MSNFSKKFREINKSDTNIAGGKGASLGEMLQVGISVPDGFVVLSTTFKHFLEETDLVQEIDSILKTVDHKIIHTVESASEKIKSLIESQSIPEDIADDIKKQFESLDSGFVAVRSSATAEDSMEHAWAGQLDSFLNTTESNLLENVKKCWASLFTPRAIFYRFEKQLHTTEISVAVVIQKMVQSEMSGIAFSVHPITENPNQLIIEAGFGLGEAIVSGSITPDSYVVDKDTKKIVDINVNIQTTGLFGKKDGGNEWLDIEEPKASSQVLNEKQILELADLIIKIEKHFSFPCDIEWAYEVGKFYITQSRPITTLSVQTTYSVSGELSNLGRIEYWAEELTPPLYGITDIKQPPCEDNFLCIYQNNTAVLYFINGREEKEAQIGFDFFSKENSIEEYTQAAKKVLEKQELLKEHNPSLQTIIKVSREFNGVYAMTEEVRLKKFENSEDEKTWDRFKKIAELRLEMRKELESILYVQSDKALSDLAKLNSMDKDDLFFYTYDELEDLLKHKTKADSQNISNRKNGYVYWIKDGEATLYTGEKFKAILNELNKSKVSENPEELKGRVASKGRVQGRVRLILNNNKNIDKQIKSFEDGEVLVTEMTRPQILIACYKAKAIITDEGGIVSHAAIISRELKIPCIIGTKIATKVLKDGDMVEVDADNGIIRIISRNE